MIPVSVTIAVEAEQLGGSCVHMLVRGSKAERIDLMVPVEQHKATDHDAQYAAGKALKKLGDALVKGEVEWSTEARNHGLPDHMLRVSAELDQVNSWLDGLNSFIGIWPDRLNERFKALPMIDQADLVEQQEYMAGYAKVLHKHLVRARAERDA